jgi:hypothetical protein
VRYIIALLLLLAAIPARAQVTTQSCNSTAVEGGHICKTGKGVLDQAAITTGASAGYWMIFDSASIPSDGAVVPAKCYQIAANSSVGIGPNLNIPFFTGITFVFSTTGCATKTISATAWFMGQTQ